MGDEWNKTRLEADIAEFQNCVEDAPLKSVDEPTGRKDVEIAYMNDDGEFIEESGVAIGVYYEPDRLNPYVVHVDWADDRVRTTAEYELIEYLDESDYYERRNC